ncbi:MAG: lactonase family protein [Planctomyces sp.]|jgi:6-phosphogluconolactonase
MLKSVVRCVFIALTGILMTADHLSAQAEELLVFVTAFSGGEDGAIHAYGLNTETGQLTLKERTTDPKNAFFIALSPDRKYLYSIHAPGQFGGKENEQVAAYSLEGRTGRMKLLNRTSALGTAACYLDVDATGKTVFVANYSTGSVASIPVRPDGTLGEAATFVQHEGHSVDKTRQDAAHAHCIVVTPDNRFVLSADLGLDRILSYRIESGTSRMVPSASPFFRTIPGAGPRHLTFHPNGRHVYVINELANSVTLFDYIKESGILTEQQTLSTVPLDFTGTSHTADVKVTPNGRFMYGTNRGHDSIACYRLNDSGRMELITIEPSLGKGPQNLVITPDGKYLLCANMPGNNLVVFRIDADTGKISSAGDPVTLTGPSCIRIY